MKKLLLLAVFVFAMMRTHAGHVHITNGTQYEIGAHIFYPIAKNAHIGIKAGEAADAPSVGDTLSSMVIDVYNNEVSVLNVNERKSHTEQPTELKPGFSGLSLAGNTTLTYTVRQHVNDDGKFYFTVDHD
jgi:hypothetical protein